MPQVLLTQFLAADQAAWHCRVEMQCGCVAAICCWNWARCCGVIVAQEVSNIGKTTHAIRFIYPPDVLPVIEDSGRDLSLTDGRRLEFTCGIKRQGCCCGR